jgi:hypothetical protein
MRLNKCFKLLLNDKTPAPLAHPNPTMVAWLCGGVELHWVGAFGTIHLNITAFCLLRRNSFTNVQYFQASGVTPS